MSPPNFFPLSSALQINLSAEIWDTKMICQYSSFFQNIRIEQSASGIHVIQCIFHTTKHCPFKYFFDYVYFTENTFIKVVTILVILF